MSSSAVSPISNPLATALPSLVVNTPDALLHGATLTTSDLPLDKGEDFVYCMTHRGTESQGDCDILAVFDGHGSSTGVLTRAFTYILKQSPLSTLLATENPMQSLITHFDGLKSEYGNLSGSTASIARIFSDRIECTNVGDSHTMVFIDGVLRYVNGGHCSSNPTEIERIRGMYGSQFRFESRESWRQEVLSPTELTMVPSRRAVFPNGPTLAPTQSLGHHDITGYAPDSMVIPYTDGQDVRVHVFSDGVADVFSLDHPADILFLSRANGAEIGAEAERRWRQEWIYVAPQRGIQPRSSTWQEKRDDILSKISPIITSFPDGSCDDIGVASWYRPGQP